jgi:hypothetical protein
MKGSENGTGVEMESARIGLKLEKDMKGKVHGRWIYVNDKRGVKEKGEEEWIWKGNKRKESRL